MTFDGAAAAARLRAGRAGIGDRLAALVADWSKYAADHDADADAFARAESDVLVDYMASFLSTGDENYRSLYVGEKAKQFHDPALDADARGRREAALLAGERAVFASALADLPGADAAIDAAFAPIERALLAEAAATVTILFVGDCLFLDAIAFLTALALADGVRIAPQFVSSHDPHEIRAAASALADTRFDLVVYSPFTYALPSDYEALQRGGALRRPRDLARRARAAVDQGVAIFDVLADLFDCPLVAHAPAPIVRHEGTLRERIVAGLTRPFRAQACRALGTALRARAAARTGQGQVVYILDEAAIVAGVGIWAAGRYLYRSTLQHPAAFGALLAAEYRDIVMVVGRLIRRKLVVCDLDNTLWRGVIGEGLGIDHHLDRQASLLLLKERGVVLAINSKNDAGKVVWAAAPGRLSLDHFMSRQINWDPKALNMRRIAEHLNLKEKDFVFVDDRADERAIIEERYPAMLTLDALDPRSWRLLALWAALLLAKPGADRSDFYRQRDARQAFIAGEAETGERQRGEMFGQLQLRLDVREAGEDDVARVTDLVNRTNQFNMNGSRVTARAIREQVASAEARVLVADAADRFGAMGTIAALIVERSGAGLAIPVFVLSCRVFGYGMEYAILEQARRLAPAGGALFGAYRATAHNQPCREVYPTAGFTTVDGGWRLESGLARPIGVPEWLAVNAAIAPFAERVAEPG